MRLASLAPLCLAFVPAAPAATLESTQFRDEQGGAIRDSLLQPGDEISVTAKPDDPETAARVVLVRKRDNHAL